MEYTIQNDKLTVVISDIGAEMMSIQKDGCEYLWQGDAKYWDGRACNLFPICGRLTNNTYIYKGKKYKMMIHGFAKDSLFEVTSHTENHISFVLKANDETRKIYPFNFEYMVEYALHDATLQMKYTAKNNGESIMYSAFGGHPGFNVPLGGDGAFEDYYVEFKSESPAQKMVFDSCYTTDNTVPFPLEKGKIFRLTHDLFDNDAIFIKDMCHTITLKSDKSEKSVTLHYPDMQYLGFWHAPKSDAPYLCIEPWQSVPSYLNVVDDIETKRDLYLLKQGETRCAQIDLTIE